VEQYIYLDGASVSNTLPACRATTRR
jgi:hypothetical protein